MRFSRTSIVVLILLMAASAVAQTIRIPVWTANGEVLTAPDLTATVAGQPAQIVNVQGPQDDLLVLLVLDMVGDLNRIDLARNGLVSAIQQAPPMARFAAMRAQGGLRVLEDPSADRDQLYSAIRNFPVAGTPGLLETIEAVSELADGIYGDSPVRLAVLYVTDSEIDKYREDFSNPVVNRSDRGDLSRRFPETIVRERISALDNRLSSSLVPIFTVHLNYNSRALDEAYQNGILQLSSATGGQAVFCRTDSEIPGAIEDMMHRILTQYAVDIEVPADASEVAAITLTSASGADLTYRTRYRLTAD